MSFSNLQIFQHAVSLEPVQVTGLRRLGAGEERFADHARAARNGELPGIGIDVDERDVFRRLEGDVGRAGQRPLRELGQP